MKDNLKGVGIWGTKALSVSEGKQTEHDRRHADER